MARTSTETVTVHQTPDQVQAEMTATIKQLRHEIGQAAVLIRSQRLIIERMRRDAIAADKELRSLRWQVKHPQAAAGGTLEALLAFSLKVSDDLKQLLLELQAAQAGGKIEEEAFTGHDCSEEDEHQPLVIPDPPVTVEELAPEPQARKRPGPPAASAPRRCSIDWCDKKHAARGFCYRHYEQWRNHGDALLSRRRVPGQTEPVLMRETGPKQYERVEGGTDERAI
jgi:hypothetical protein